MSTIGILVTTALVVSNNVVLSIAVTRLGYDVVDAHPRESDWLARCPFCDVVLLDVGTADRATQALELIRRSHDGLPVIVLAHGNSDWSKLPAFGPATIVLRERITPAVLQSVLDAALRQVTEHIDTVAPDAVPSAENTDISVAAPEMPALADPPKRPSQPEPVRARSGTRASGGPATWLVVTDDPVVAGAISDAWRGITVANEGDRWLGVLPRVRGVVLYLADSDSVFTTVRNIRRRGFVGPVQALWEDSGSTLSPDRVRVRRLAVDLVPALVERLSAGHPTGERPVARAAGRSPRVALDKSGPSMRIVVVSAEPSLGDALRAAGLDATSVDTDERRLLAVDVADAFVVDVNRFVLARRVLARLHSAGHARPVLVAWRDVSASTSVSGDVGDVGDVGEAERVAAFAPSANGSLRAAPRPPQRTDPPAAVPAAVQAAVPPAAAVAPAPVVAVVPPAAAVAPPAAAVVQAAVPPVVQAAVPPAAAVAPAPVVAVVPPAAALVQAAVPPAAAVAPAPVAAAVVAVVPAVVLAVEPPTVTELSPEVPGVPAVIDLVDPYRSPPRDRVTVPQLSVDEADRRSGVTAAPPLRSRRRRLPTRPPATPPSRPALPDERQATEVLTHALQAVDTFVSLHEVATALATEALEVVHADAVALLVHSDTHWTVESGVALRLLEQRQTLAEDAWIIQQSVERQLAVVIEDSDQTRWQLEGVPTGSHKYVAAVPVAIDHALLLVGRDSEPFSEDAVTQLVALATEAGPLVQRGVLLRTVASRFGQHRP